jgi:hypothetical protein
MTPLSPPVRIGRFEPVILDSVVRWGPVCVLTARPTRHRIQVEYAYGHTPATLRRSEPRC